MKLFCASIMLMILSVGIYQFWLHDFSNFFLSMTTFLVLRNAAKQLKNDL